jgi:hypothetical protein
VSICVHLRFNFFYFPKKALLPIKPTWDSIDQATAFGTDLAPHAPDYGKISAANALAMTTTGGAGDEKNLAEADLENSSSTLARAANRQRTANSSFSSLQR